MGTVGVLGALVLIGFWALVAEPPAPAPAPSVHLTSDWRGVVLVDAEGNSAITPLGVGADEATGRIYVYDANGNAVWTDAYLRSYGDGTTLITDAYGTMLPVSTGGRIQLTGVQASVSDTGQVTLQDADGRAIPSAGYWPTG